MTEDHVMFQTVTESLSLSLSLLVECLSLVWKKNFQLCNYIFNAFILNFFMLYTYAKIIEYRPSAYFCKVRWRKKKEERSLNLIPSAPPPAVSARIIAFRFKMNNNCLISDKLRVIFMQKQVKIASF